MCLERVLARNALAVRKRPARETTLERPSGSFGLSVDTPLRLLYFHLLAFFFFGIHEFITNHNKHVPFTRSAPETLLLRKPAAPMPVHVKLGDPRIEHAQAVVSRL